MDVMLTIFGPTTPGEDAAAVAAGFRKAGANQMVFFTSLYHGYRLIQRRYPQRAVYSLETDRIFYQSDASLYKGLVLQPQRSLDAPNVDYLATLSKACKAEGIAFIPLVPMCAAERMVQDHPELAVTNLYGAKDRLFLCYNHPEVRKYRFAMIRDIAGRYDIDALMLDKIPQTMLEQAALSGLFDAPLRTVGSFCFCPHCKAAAAKAGLDLEEVRARCLALAERSLRMPPYVVAALAEGLVGDTEIPLLLLEEPLVYRMLQFRFDTAVAFVAEAREVLRSLRPGMPMHVAFVPPCHIGHDVTAPRSWLTVQSYQKYRDVVDAIMCVVHWPADVVRFETQRAVDAAEGKTKVYTAMRLYGPTTPQEVPALADAALAGGSSSISFLGYDVATDDLLAALGNWVREKGKN